MLNVIFGADGGIGADNKDKMANEKYRNNNMWFGGGQCTLSTSNSLSADVFNSKFRFSINVL